MLVITLKKVFVFSLALLLLTNLNPISACTRILINEDSSGVFVGRNMDWNEEMETNLLFYPRNIHRSGHHPHAHPVQKNWISWDSKYANIVATGYENFTTDGFNEKGLAVHILWFEDSDYGTPDPIKPWLSLTQWTQFYLDNFKSVEEAVQFTKTHPFDVVTFFHPLTEQWGRLHLVLDDASGDSAIFEHVDGVLRIHHDRSVIVATNEPSYEQHLLNLRGYEDFGGNKPLPGTPDSFDRFVRATHFTNILPKSMSLKETLGGILGILKNVAHPYTKNYRTIWHIISDLTNKTYYFQSYENQNFVSVKFDRFDPESSVTMKLDLVNNPEYVGDVSDKFQPLLGFNSHF